MLFTFTGAQSTGKTTLLKECKKTFSWYTFVEKITRNVADTGAAINQKGTDDTQLLIAAAHIQNALSHEFAFLDRCALDGLVYTEYLYRQGKVSEDIYTIARGVYNLLVPKYDLIFYTSPKDVPLTDDGVRAMGEEGIQFRENIIKLFNSHIERDCALRNKLIVLEGTVEQRMSKIKQEVYNAASR